MMECPVACRGRPLGGGPGGLTYSVGVHGVFSIDRCRTDT